MSLPDGTPHAIADASDHPRPRVLLIASTTGYQVREFANAAERLGIELVFATDRCHVLQDPWGDAAIPLRFTDVSSGLDTLVEIANAPEESSTASSPSAIARLSSHPKPLHGWASGSVHPILSPLVETSSSRANVSGQPVFWFPTTR